MVSYKKGNDLQVDDVIGLYNDSGLGARRPVGDKDRIRSMLANANIVISAWNNGELVGIARALSDLSYVTYLSDIAVKKKYQQKGIGKEMIRRLQNETGTKIVLLSAPDAEGYYPKIGFQKHISAWVLDLKDK